MMTIGLKWSYSSATSTSAGVPSAISYRRLATGRWPDDVKYSSGMPIHVIACPQRPLPPLADPPTYTTGWRRSRARPTEVVTTRSEEHTSELQSQSNLVCRLLLE